MSERAALRTEPRQAEAGAAASAPAKLPRVAALDVMRGFVMLLMAVDHASETFNGGRVFTDSFAWWKPGSALPPAQFLTRWATHVCAPTFVTLAGAALAMSVERRRQKGRSEREIDRYVAGRGFLLVAIELAWMSWVMIGPGRWLFQVIWAIGGSLVCMAALRRLSDRALLVTGVAYLTLSELLVGVFAALGVVGALPVAFLVSGGIFYDGKLVIAYPLLPWLAMMMIGWALGRRVLAWGGDARRASRVLAVWGLSGLGIFGVVRGVNAYGNMRLLRDSWDAVQWLHVSKYPPSLTFAGLELGIMALCLAALFRLADERPSFGGPLLVLGQVALFFYLLHIHAMELVAWLFDIKHALGLASAWIGGAAVTLALYVPCRFYRAYKAKNPGGWRQYI